MAKHRLFLLVALTFACDLNLRAAEISSQWLGTTDDSWGTAANWDPEVIPNNGGDTYAVTLPPALPGAVLINGSFTVQSATVGSESVLAIDNNSQLTIKGFVENNGIIAPASNTRLSISGSNDSTVSIKGSGSLVLDMATERLVGATNHTLIHASPHTIQGAGTVGGNFIKIINRGTISADDSTGTMVLDPRDTLANEGGTLFSIFGRNAPAQPRNLHLHR